MSIKIHIISGFLGAGKTTFLKKIISHFKEKTALIENEFGDVSIDSDILSGEELLVRELYSGCICCTLLKDFKTTIEELCLNYDIQNIFIEPSGVASLSDILKSCASVEVGFEDKVIIQSVITIVDASSFDDYIESFGEFYTDQIKNAKGIFISHINEMKSTEINKIIYKIRDINKEAFILNEDWGLYSGEEIIDLLDSLDTYKSSFEEETNEVVANNIFNTISFKYPKVFQKKELENLSNIFKEKSMGNILRAKGIIKAEDQNFVHFDFTPNHFKIEVIENPKETKVALIGTDLNKEKLSEIFANILGGERN